MLVPNPRNTWRIKVPRSKEMITTEELICLKETPKAFLFQTSSNPRETFWIPKSQIQDPAVEDIAEGTIQEIYIPHWLADEKGLT